MLFIYFISLLYLTQPAFCQITSESEAINKIIGNILLKAEKKNAETQDFIWNDYFSMTEKPKYLSRSPKKLLDFNPFLRTQYPRSKPTLKLHDLLPGLNKPQQVTKNTEKVFGDNVPKFEFIDGSQPDKDKYYDITKTTFPLDKINENFETNSPITNFMIKIQRKTSTPVMEQTVTNSLIPDGPHDKMFSESIFSTPQTIPTYTLEELKTMHKDPTTTSSEFSFDTMESATPMNTITGIKIFHYGDKTTGSKTGKYPFTPSTAVTVTHTDMISLKDAEDLVNSVPNYDKTSESFDDFLKRVTDPGYDVFNSPEMKIENTKYNDGIEEITEPTESINKDKLLEEYEKIKTITEEDVSDEFRISNPSHFTTTTDSSDEYLSTEPKDKSVKSIFSHDHDSAHKEDQSHEHINYDLAHKEDQSHEKINYDLANKEEDEWLNRIEGYMDDDVSPATTTSSTKSDKFLDTTKNRLVDPHKPCTPSTRNYKEEIKIIETNINDELNDKKATTSKIESELAKKKGVKFDKEDHKQYEFTEKSKKIDSFCRGEGNTQRTEKVNVVTEKTANVAEKENTIYNKQGNAVDKDTKNKIKIDSKQNKAADRKMIMQEITPDAKKSQIAYKQPKVTEKVIEIAGKDTKKFNTTNNVVDKKITTQGAIKSDKTFKGPEAVTSKSVISDKKSNIADKKNNPANKKGNMADLYDDILKIYGSLKETTEKAPQRIHDKIVKHLNWESVKRFFGHDRVCNCKCRENKTLCKVCAASDIVMRELLFEFNNLAEYMNTHCTEIQTFFWMNPSGGKKLRDTVHRIDRTMQDYYKRVRGKCTGKACNTFATYLDKKRYIDKKKRERKYLLEILRDLEISAV